MKLVRSLKLEYYPKQLYYSKLECYSLLKRFSQWVFQPQYSSLPLSNISCTLSEMYFLLQFGDPSKNRLFPSYWQVLSQPLSKVHHSLDAWNELIIFNDLLLDFLLCRLIIDQRLRICHDNQRKYRSFADHLFLAQ